jgi:hypothetical protein
MRSFYDHWRILFIIHIYMDNLSYDNLFKKKYFKYKKKYLALKNQLGGVKYNNPMWNKNRVPSFEKKKITKQITSDNIKNELDRREIRKCEKCKDSNYYNIHPDKCKYCLEKDNLSENIKKKINENGQKISYIKGVDPKDYDKNHFKWYQKKYGEDPNVFTLDKKWQKIKKDHEQKLIHKSNLNDQTFIIDKSSIESRLDKIEKLLLNHSHSISTGGIEPYREYEMDINKSNLYLRNTVNSNLIPKEKIIYKIKKINHELSPGTSHELSPGTSHELSPGQTYY